jgi:hypothetical protein
LLILLAVQGFNSTARVDRASQTQQKSAPRLLLSQETQTVQVPENCRNITPDAQRHGDAGYVIDPSPTLTQYLTKQVGNTKGYDEGKLDVNFVDSFKLKNCRVCYATLEYRIKHDGSEWRNDTFVAGVAPFTDSRLYFFRPENRCFNKPDIIGCIWVVPIQSANTNANASATPNPSPTPTPPPDPNPKTVTLGITPTALAALNNYLVTGPTPTYLDVRGEDDTEFDYIVLRVWYY